MSDKKSSILFDIETVSREKINQIRQENLVVNIIAFLIINYYLHVYSHITDM